MIQNQWDQWVGKLAPREANWYHKRTYYLIISEREHKLEFCCLNTEFEYSSNEWKAPMLKTYGLKLSSLMCFLFM